MLGSLQRISFNGMTPALAEQVFRWQDDLVFTVPKGTTGDRPVAMGQSEGNVSWFLTVGPVQPNFFRVAVVVCYKRVFGNEQLCTATAPGGGPLAIAYGGGAVALTPQVAGTTVRVKENQWILLCNGNGSTACWYRVANAGPAGSPTSPQLVSVVGPDWPAGVAATAVIIDSVTGVYSEVVQLD